MYSNSGYPPEFTNNPFVDDPSNPRTRFPDLSTPPSAALPSGQYVSWMQTPAAGPGYQPQPQHSMLYQYNQQPYGAVPNMGGQHGYFNPSQLPTQSQFQPSSSFGQQLTHQINGSGYGYLHGQNAAPAGPGDNFRTPQQQVISQFDPYGAIGQGWDGRNQSQSLQPNPSNPSSTTSSTSNPHPRDYIRTHKAELEIWDTYSWKQLFSTFESLKGAWETRKNELEGRVAQLQAQLQYGGGGYYAGQIQQEQARLQEVSLSF